MKLYYLGTIGTGKTNRMDYLTRILNNSKVYPRVKSVFDSDI